MKMGVQWSIYPSEEIKLTAFFFKEKYLSTASSTAPDLQPVDNVAAEYPKIDSHAIVEAQGLTWHTHLL